jgi:hypothetical protein
MSKEYLSVDCPVCDKAVMVSEFPIVIREDNISSEIIELINLRCKVKIVPYIETKGIIWHDKENCEYEKTLNS